MTIIRILIHVMQQSIRKHYIQGKDLPNQYTMQKQQTENRIQNSNSRQITRNSNPRHNKQIFLHKKQIDHHNNYPQQFIRLDRIQNCHQSKPLLEAEVSNGQKSKNQTCEILINAIIWIKQVKNLFDYEEQIKIVKSGISINQTNQHYINYVNSNSEELNNLKNNVFCLLYKTQLKNLIQVKKTLNEITSYDLVQKQNNEKNRMYFLCSLKLTLNKLTNRILVKVYSAQQMSKMISPNIASHCTQLLPNQLQTSINDPYFIVRSLVTRKSSQYKGYQISPGDLIKLGKVEFKVVSVDGISHEDLQSQMDRRAIEVTQIPQQIENEIQCKYCLGGKQVEGQNNFFLHLCDCKGHIGYVHYDCLTKWTTTKATIESFQCVKMYFLEKMKCQVCLKQFPKYFRYNGKLYHLLPIQLPKKHLMLVDVSHKQDAMTAVINGQSQKLVTIGRGRNSIMKVNDISVSRQHATIQRVGDGYQLKDCRSKFGTTIRPSQKVLSIDLDKKKGFQINNTIFTIQAITREEQKLRQLRLQKQQKKQKVQIKKKDTINHKTSTGLPAVIISEEQEDEGLSASRQQQNLSNRQNVQDGEENSNTRENKKLPTQSEQKIKDSNI